MDGIHDLGGRQGFGKIAVDEAEEPFHHPWEGRMWGIARALGGMVPGWNIDWWRHGRELIEPVDYLTRPYYDQWMQNYAALLIDSGVATVDEVVSGHSGTPATAAKPPMTAGDVTVAKAAMARFDRPLDGVMAFAIGDRVRTRAMGSTGHTRLPGYARGRAGIVHACHGGHVLPDASARGEDRAETLYSVVFEAAELWPDAKGRRDRVFIDLWESYLEPA
jgi:nitrile hydratase beta subunit